MPTNTDIHNHISHYLELKKRDFHTKEFGFTSYTAPNTMFSINNQLPQIMMDLTPATLKFWLRSLILLRRSPDPVLACTIHVQHKYYKDITGRTTYYKAIKELIEKELFIPTLRKSIYIVNITYANKLYKPKPNL